MYSQQQRWQYPAEFKRESGELLLSGNKTAKEVAADLGLRKAERRKARNA